ncbi:dTDP-4-dehydrorhamnose 3,5-epimerase [Flavobacteriaceae bacterium]|jgi:dTDP-4-dehydrorhamnose 3,5-epimerase|nr:dTDP-4-dehydrorhamnose 3,5-epimerase [Flavobacteriaceae bacterium]
MKKIETYINDLIIFEPEIYRDERGYFFESYNKKELKNINVDSDFVQDNESSSSYGVLRGLHFQEEPFDQAKLIRCLKGEVLDVVVDLRKKSSTYLKHFSIKLSDVNKYQLYIPKGFAHGFVVLSKNATFSYKVDNYYSPNHERGIIWNDSSLNIDWKVPKNKIIISDKDQKLPSLL